MRKLVFAAAILLLVGTAGCYNDKYDQLYVTPPTTTCDTTAVSYATSVVPIINANCNVSGGCHDAAGYAVSGYNFSTYTGVQAVANYDFMISDITGNPTARHHAMPLNLPKISQCDINIITAWIDQGALNN